MRKYPVLLVTRKVQIKTTMSYGSILPGWLKFKGLTISSIGQDMEQTGQDTGHSNTACWYANSGELFCKKKKKTNCMARAVIKLKYTPFYSFQQK